MEKNESTNIRAAAEGDASELSGLLPCPFCGGEVELERTIDKRKWWGIVCRNTINLGGTCAVQIIPSASKGAAIARWNMRNGKAG